MTPSLERRANNEKSVSYMYNNKPLIHVHNAAELQVLTALSPKQIDVLNDLLASAYTLGKKSRTNEIAKLLGVK